MGKKLNIRKAEPGDVPAILELIQDLARYENLLAEVSATEEILNEWLFAKEKAEVLMGECEGVTVGYALFFHNFSTFLGRAGIYIEDLYIKPEYRGLGFGKAFFQYIAKLTLDRGCGRLEWACLDWNQPSIDFYLSMGSQAMGEWTIYRLSGDSLAALVVGL